MANIKDFIKKIGNSAVSLEEQQQALAQVEKTIIEAKQKRTEVVGKNADMVIQALKTIEAKLEAKLTELNNTPAKQGVQGPVGKDGKDGKDGKNGRDGLNGKDGTDGKDGVDGKDGISVVDAKIDFDGSLVVYLSNGSEIDCGQILQPEVAKNIIISSGGSGTSQVVTDTLVSLQNQINTLTGIDGVLGDMAQQNANAVAITGGTINGTTIGATTPSSIVGTTITGQTANLTGTAQNFLLYSQDFTNAYWGKVAVTNTANTTTAPDGTTTASTVIPAASNAFHELNSSTVSGFSGYTLSVYVKNNGYQYCYLNFGGLGGGNVGFDITALTTYSVGSNISNTSITSVGNGWLRISATANGTFFRCDLGITSTAFIGNTTTNGTSGMFVWGFQLEYGYPIRAYQVTTTTAVSGTFPLLSFGGASKIGVESTGSLYLQPAGTGAIQAQATTSTTAGGNVRGANAVDWQTSRSAASQVASSTYGVVGGGVFNVSSGFAGTVAGGSANQTTAQYATVGGGATNVASGSFSTISGGFLNTSAGWYNFIGGGWTNAGTALAAVTTQSGTMNATTAVTLSGSNASIKVGQYITGTSIASDTYVAAISGTSLTLSKNASGSSTSTLSFFTPHGVVVGGGNNQATGSYSFIGGGGDAGTAANRNVASGDWSVVAGGLKGVASGQNAFVGGGSGAIASGTYAVVSGGVNNQATGFGSTSIGGYNNISNSAYSATLGGNFASTRGIEGISVFGSQTPLGGTLGLAQSSLLVLAVQTTDATATVLRSNASAASTNNQVILPNNSAYYFKGSVIANVTGAANGAAWSIEGAIMRGANAASTVLIDTPSVNRVATSAGATAWVVAVTADTTNGGIAVTVTGVAATTIRWVCKLETTEVTY